MHDLFGLMVESSLDHELAEDLIGEYYLQSILHNGVNRRLDDRSEANLNKIIKMGEDWWDKFGEKAVKLMNEAFNFNHCSYSGMAVQLIWLVNSFVIVSETEIQMGVI